MGYKELLRDNETSGICGSGSWSARSGDWLNNIALLALVIELTHSAFAVAIYVMARHLPLFLFGPIAGVVSDRLSRRAVMIVSDIIRAALALSFLAIRGHSQLWIVYVSSAGLMVLSIFFTAAKRASIPRTLLPVVIC